MPASRCSSCAADPAIPALYVKFDLGRELISGFHELQSAAEKIAAERVCLVLRVAAPWALPDQNEISLLPHSNYVALKAPTLEGTELWIVLESLQEEFEKAVGFEKKSDPVLIFGAQRLDGGKARHPFADRELLITLGGSKLPDSGEPEARLKVTRDVERLLDDTGSLIARWTISSEVSETEPHPYICPNCREASE